MRSIASLSKALFHWTFGWVRELIRGNEGFYLRLILTRFQPGEETVFAFVGKRFAPKVQIPPTAVGG